MEDHDDDDVDDPFTPSPISPATSSCEKTHLVRNPAPVASDLPLIACFVLPITSASNAFNSFHSLHVVVELVVFYQTTVLGHAVFANSVLQRSCRHEVPVRTLCHRQVHFTSPLEVVSGLEEGTRATTPVAASSYHPEQPQTDLPPSSSRCRARSCRACILKTRNLSY